MRKKGHSYKKGTEAFFNIVMEGLGGEVDGESFWDAVAEDEDNVVDRCII